MRTKQLYSILGLQDGATVQEVIKAARVLMGKNHPDRGGDEEIFKKISNAKDDLLAYLDGVKAPEPKKEPEAKPKQSPTFAEKMASKIREFILSLPESQRSPFTQSPEIFSEAMDSYLASKFENAEAKSNIERMTFQMLRKHSGIVQNWGKFKQLILDSLPTVDEQVISIVSKLLESHVTEFRAKNPQKDVVLTPQQKITKSIRDFILALPEDKRSPFTQSPETFANSILAYIKSEMTDEIEKREVDRVLLLMFKKHSGILESSNKFIHAILESLPTDDEKVVSSIVRLINKNISIFMVCSDIYPSILQKISATCHAGFDPSEMQRVSYEISLLLAKASLEVLTLEKKRDIEISISVRFSEISPDFQKREELIKESRVIIDKYRNIPLSTSDFLKNTISEYYSNPELAQRLLTLVGKNANIYFDFQDSVFICKEVHNLCASLGIPLLIENKIMNLLPNLHKDALPQRQ